jgi:uncharacterized membrane protein
MTKENKDIIVVIFDGVDGGRQAYEALAEVRGGAYVKVEDTAIVYKDAEGNVKTDNQVSHGAKMAGVTGGGIGLLIGFLIGGPIGGAAVGALGGALASRFAGVGIDGKFVKQVRDELKPDTSALFLLSEPEARDLIVASMGPLQGTLYYSTLPAEAEDLLRDYLK